MEFLFCHLKACVVIIWNNTKFVLFIFGTCKTLHKCPELYRNRYARWVFCRLLKDDDRWKVDLQLGKFSVACVRMFGNCQKLREGLNFECSLRPSSMPGDYRKYSLKENVCAKTKKILWICSISVFSWFYT